MINKKIVKQKIHEKWIPKLEAHLNEKGMNIPNKQKLQKIAEMAHVRKLYEQAATPTNVPGRGATALGNNPGLGFSTEVGSGEVFQDLFGVFIDVAAATFGMDLLPVLPMSKSNITVHITEPIYADGVIDRSDNKPKLFQVAIAITGTVNLVVGTTYTIKTAATGGEDVGDVIYVGLDKMKGHAVFRRVAENDNTGGGGTDWTTKTIAEMVNGNGIFVDASNYVSFDETTVDYVSMFRNFVGGYSGAGNDDDQNWYLNRQTGTDLHNAPMSREVGERKFHNSLGLRQWHKNYQAKTIKVDIEYTSEQIVDMKMDHDVDALELGAIAMQEQLGQSINDFILGKIFSYGWSHHKVMNEVSGFNMNAFIGTGTGAAQTFYGYQGTPLTIAGNTGVIPTTGAINENLSSLQRRVVSRLTYGTTVVKHRSRKYKGDTSIVNGTYSAAIQDIRGYKVAEFEHDIDDEGLYLMGTFNKISMYEDSLMDLTDERIAVFAKGKDNSPGLKMVTYLLADKTSTIAEATGAQKEYLHSRFNVVPVGSHPEAQYMTFTVEQGASYKLV